MSKYTSILILGLGNKYLTDDGIAIRLIGELKLEWQNPQIHFETACSGGLEILELIDGYQEVILLDAIRTLGGIPGTIYYFSTEDFKETLHASSFHDISFLGALEFGRACGINVPESIRIVAIEIVEDLYFSENFSVEISTMYSSIKKEVRDFLYRCLQKYCLAVEA